MAPGESSSTEEITRTRTYYTEDYKNSQVNKGVSSVVPVTEGRKRGQEDWHTMPRGGRPRWRSRSPETGARGKTRSQDSGTTGDERRMQGSQEPGSRLCYNCDEVADHWASNCPKPKKAEAADERRMQGGKEPFCECPVCKMNPECSMRAVVDPTESGRRRLRVVSTWTPEQRSRESSSARQRSR